MQGSWSSDLNEHTRFEVRVSFLKGIDYYAYATTGSSW